MGNHQIPSLIQNTENIPTVMGAWSHRHQKITARGVTTYSSESVPHNTGELTGNQHFHCILFSNWSIAAYVSQQHAEKFAGLIYGNNKFTWAAAQTCQLVYRPGVALYVLHGQVKHAADIAVDYPVGYV